MPGSSVAGGGAAQCDAAGRPRARGALGRAQGARAAAGGRARRGILGALSRGASMQISALDHIVLNVQDVERSLELYTGSLGLTAERVDGWRRGELPFPSVRVDEGILIDL